MRYRTYKGLDGIKRTLTFTGTLPYNVDWHKVFKPCNAELWLTETGYQLQIPVMAWRKIAYEDTET